MGSNAGTESPQAAVSRCLRALKARSDRLDIRDSAERLSLARKPEAALAPRLRVRPPDEQSAGKRKRPARMKRSAKAIPTARAVGKRGQWFAEVDREVLPCVHAHWYKNGWYHDPHYRPGDPQWEELIASVREKGRVVLTTDNASDEGR